MHCWNSLHSDRVLALIVWSTTVTRPFGLILAASLACSSAFAQGSSQAASPGLSPATGNPNLSVASVRMESGLRASKMIGAGVYADPNTQIGTVDDLMMTQSDQVTFAIVAVGGVMGMGSKLVAIPIAQLQHGADGKLILPGSSKDTLNAMPNFIY